MLSHSQPRGSVPFRCSASWDEVTVLQTVSCHDRRVCCCSAGSACSICGRSCCSWFSRCCSCSRCCSFCSCCCCCAKAMLFRASLSLRIALFHLSMRLHAILWISRCSLFRSFRTENATPVTSRSALETTRQLSCLRLPRICTTQMQKLEHSPHAAGFSICIGQNLSNSSSAQEGQISCFMRVVFHPKPVCKAYMPCCMRGAACK